ncbi:MAG: ferrochelatase [Flavobacteriaceae bacterium]|nr:ferrochelatase [Flavobacteriaceae bacterium]MBL6684146.1 ferrochelatase [Flavobacteriaceae bacterium]PDH50738.1 MAG: ferrochelatase [Cryomorphaceae bacterium MED-G14]|tara:strand:- start:1774 stop:2775 length:1002 start_codon:yes stop_codon:yes gene_type:complete
MKGFLLINLGSPDSTSIPDVKKYLDEFLMDKRVIGKSYWFRWFLVKIIILNTRPRKSAKAYKKIWWKEGSPLIVLSQRLFEKIKKLIKIPIALAMRYGSISIVKGLKELNDYGVKEVVVLPLYPHYAMSSYETVVEKVKKEVKLNFPSLKLKIIKPFYKNKNYIKLLSNKIKETISKIEYDHILFSYHGIPVSHLKISDPTNKHCYKIKNCCSVSSQAHETCYKHQVLETTELIVKELNIDKDKYSNAFQSRLPNEAWLKPYTDNELERLAKKGIKNLVIVTPAFVTDCLETLEEIAMEGKEEFLEAGGENYHYVPCLNDDDDWAKLIASWAK